MAEAPSDAERMHRMFVGFCKTVIRHALQNFYRKEGNRYKRIRPTTDMECGTLQESYDYYPSDHYQMSIGRWKAEMDDEHLYSAIERLSYKQREVIVLYFWYGMKEEEIAGILGISRQAVNYRKNKAIQQIRDELIRRR